MTKFNMNQNLENLVSRYAGNLQTVENSQTRDPKIEYTENVYNEQDPVEVKGIPKKVRDHALAHMSLFPDFFKEHGLGKEQWSDFLETYYKPLKTEVKGELIKRIMPYLGEEEIKKLQKNSYFTILALMEQLAGFAKKEDLNEQELEAIVKTHFIDGIEMKDNKPVGKINPYAAAAISDYKGNKEGVKSLMEMRLRLYELQKKKTDMGELDELMKYSETDKRDNYSIGNYAKATMTYRMSKAQEEAEKKQQKEAA